MILACKLRRKRRNESIDFQPLAKKACERRNVSLFLQDKGYDAERHHKFVRYELKSKMIAPLRRHGKKSMGSIESKWSNCRRYTRKDQAYPRMDILFSRAV